MSYRFEFSHRCSASSSHFAFAYTSPSSLVCVVAVTVASQVSLFLALTSLPPMPLCVPLISSRFLCLAVSVSMSHCSTYIRLQALSLLLPTYSLTSHATLTSPTLSVTSLHDLAFLLARHACHHLCIDIVCIFVVTAAPVLLLLLPCP